MTNYLEPGVQGELPIGVRGEVYASQYFVHMYALQAARFDLIREAAKFCVGECREEAGPTARVVVRCSRTEGSLPYITVRATAITGEAK